MLADSVEAMPVEHQHRSTEQPLRCVGPVVARVDIDAGRHDAPSGPARESTPGRRIDPLTCRCIAERQAIEKALRETDRNKAMTARRRGLTRTQLYVRLRKYDVERPRTSEAITLRVPTRGLGGGGTRPGQPSR